MRQRRRNDPAPSATAASNARGAGSGTTVVAKFVLSGAKSEMAAVPAAVVSRGHRFHVYAVLPNPVLGSSEAATVAVIVSSSITTEPAGRPTPPIDPVPSGRSRITRSNSTPGAIEGKPTVPAPRFTPHT